MVGEAQATVSETTAYADTTVPALSEFLDTVPHQLTAALVYFAPYIGGVRYAVEVCCWRRSWCASWLSLALLWAICLLGDSALRYLLPALLLALSAVKVSRHPPQPVTEATMQAIVADLILIQELIPPLQSLTQSWSPPPLHVLARVIANVYVPYLILTYGVPLRILIATAGTLALSWRAPWLIVVRRTLWRSAYIRWTIYSLWARLSGQPMPEIRISNQPTLETPQAVNSLRFLFEVYENQRWWMGLDFTAALLPSERPSWCSKNQQPLSPPNSFALPEQSIVYLPATSGHGRIKRTATWKWEEEEWTVVVHKEGGAVSRVERPYPTIKDDQSILNKAAAKMRESSGPASPRLSLDEGKGGEDHPSHKTQDQEDETITDADGWVYGDNSWEHQTAKGGMGKYTRYRRWTRVAVVFETVDVVEDGELGLQRGRSTSKDAKKMRRASAASNASEDSGSPLRQRLRNALARGSTVG